MADISKIKLNDVEYEIKDLELRHMINVLLGLEDEPEEEINTVPKR